MFLGVLVVLLVAVSFAYAAANTVPVTGAGDGSATISGYTVTNVHYVLSGGDASTIESVTFSLTPVENNALAPTTVKVKLQSSGSTWYTCNSSGTTWSCPVNGPVAVTVADNLRIVAAQ